MITIATYRSLMSAELAKTRLESNAIRATIADACSYTLGYGSVIDGVRLQVPDADAERAKEILASREYIALPDDAAIVAEAPEADAVKEPAAEGTARRFDGRSILPLFLSGILCLILAGFTGHWIGLRLWSGPLILLGEVLILAGLWIFYGQLSAAGEDEPDQEALN